MRTITDQLTRIEACYDAIPRVGGAIVVEFGSFVIFIREGVGWPYYARPRPDVPAFTTADVVAVGERQRELGVPVTMEWIHELAPTLLAAAVAAGLEVHQAPLLALDPDALPASDEFETWILDPDDAVFANTSADLSADTFADAFAASQAVAQLGFGAAGTAAGPDGPARRDELVTPTEPGLLAYIAAGIRAGTKAEAVVRVPGEGIVARGALQLAAGAAEVVGVATLPAARRRGLGAAVTAALARYALAAGADPVFLGAASDDVARVYERIGFRRLGTACIVG